jgi:hypothetical protein
MFVSFSLAELVPFVMVVYGIYLQIDWYKKKEDDKDCNNINDSLMDKNGNG